MMDDIAPLAAPVASRLCPHSRLLKHQQMHRERLGRLRGTDGRWGVGACAVLLPSSVYITSRNYTSTKT